MGFERMALIGKLDRTLRAVDDSTDGEDYYEVTDRSSSESLIETAEGGEVMSSEADELDVGKSESMSDAPENNRMQARMNDATFGTLTVAQHALQKEKMAENKRERNAHASKSHEDKLEVLRERLRAIKAEKLAGGVRDSSRYKKSATIEALGKKRSDVEDDSQDDSNSVSDSEILTNVRSSKHAPAVQSSKRMVSRKRQVLEVKKSTTRDPRFDNIHGGRLDSAVVDTRYSFLNDYRASEIADLRSTVKNAKKDDEKQRLQQQLLSMESQEQTRKRKEEQQDVVRQHKKREKELVKQGKQPFYLKRSEQKKIALVDRFQNMKAKQRDQVIERRRKKAVAKERKRMPDERRFA